MPEKSEVIRRLRAGQSIREINRETGIHRATIRSLKELAVIHDWLVEDIELPDDDTIQKELMGNTEEGFPIAQHPLDLYLDEIEKWLKDKTSFLLIHEFLRQRGVELSETSVRRYIHRKFPGQFRRPVTLRETRSGEILEVDYGYFGLTYDSQEKRNRKTWFLSARLRHSRHAYRQYSFDQKQETFFSALINAFEFFGGVAQKIVPDNMKSAVIQASFTDPEINRVFQKMAQYYNFLISPTLPYTPRHKGGVENDVKYVKGNFWPRYKEAEKQKGHSVPHAEGLQEALEKWGEDVASVRTIRGLGRSPLSIFEEEEKTALKKLPINRWSIVSLSQAKVQQTWRIQFDNAFYSVPYQYIGESVTILADTHFVSIYLKEKEIARHLRAVGKWEIKRSDHHAPPGADEVSRQNEESLLRWADDIGEEVQRMCRAIFSRQGIDGIQSARSLCHLAKKYGRDRLNRACRRALQFKATRYRDVKKILQDDLEPNDSIKVAEEIQPSTYRFQREPDYFDPDRKRTPKEVLCG